LPARRLLLAPTVAATLLAPVLGLPALGLAGADAAGGPRLVPSSPASSEALGFDRLGVRRGDTWHLRDALDGGPSRSYREHLSGWLPVAGDTDGDGSDALHLFRDGVWLLRDREGDVPRVLLFGQAGDQPVMGDWDGDGVATPGVFRAGRWLLRDGDRPAAGTGDVHFGVRGDVAVVGDWDGDGDTDLGVRRGATWFQRDAATSGAAHRSFSFGRAGDLPVTGDWDHDGRDEVGVFRDGTWLFRSAAVGSGQQSTRFGLPGDLPVVRRVRGLGPGVSHRVLRNPAVPYTAHVATVDLAAASRPDVVLAQDRLPGLEVLSSMARRARAVVAVNGDYALTSGRPVHVFADDGVLAQTPQLLGRAVAFDATGSRVAMGFPDVRVSVTAAGGAGAVTAEVAQVNGRAPRGRQLAGWTAAGSGLTAPPPDVCYAGLRPAGAPAVGADGVLRSPLTVTGRRCGGPPPAVPRDHTVIAAVRDPADSAFVRSLSPRQPVQLSAQLGFPGAVDVLGGNPLLVSGGRVVDADVGGAGAFFRRNPRTVVGVTRTGRLLLVVVDGRQPGYSAGATLRETAELMRALGAVEAINLDGGGSSEMVLNGLVVNRPSDRRERAVSSALAVLPSAERRSGDGLAVPALPALPSPSRPGGEAARDAGSTGGLADALQRHGATLPAELEAAAELFGRAGR
jgi:hypothetical protein